MGIPLHNFHIRPHRRVEQRGAGLAYASADLIARGAAGNRRGFLVSLGSRPFPGRLVEGEGFSRLHGNPVDRLGAQLDVCVPVLVVRCRGGIGGDQAEAVHQLRFGHFRQHLFRRYPDGGRGHAVIQQRGQPLVQFVRINPCPGPVFRKGKLRKFCIADALESKEIAFDEAVKFFECEENEPKKDLSNLYFEYISKM